MAELLTNGFFSCDKTVNSLHSSTCFSSPSDESSPSVSSASSSIHCKDFSSSSLLSKCHYPLCDCHHFSYSSPWAQNPSMPPPSNNSLSLNLFSTSASETIVQRKFLTLTPQFSDPQSRSVLTESVHFGRRCLIYYQIFSLLLFILSISLGTLHFEKKFHRLKSYDIDLMQKRSFQYLLSSYFNFFQQDNKYVNYNDLNTSANSVSDTTTYCSYLYKKYFSPNFFLNLSPSSNIFPILPSFPSVESVALYYDVTRKPSSFFNNNETVVVCPQFNTSLWYTPLIFWRYLLLFFYNFFRYFQIHLFNLFSFGFLSYVNIFATIFSPLSDIMSVLSKKLMYYLTSSLLHMPCFNIYEDMRNVTFELQTGLSNEVKNQLNNSTEITLEESLMRNAARYHFLKYSDNERSNLTTIKGEQNCQSKKYLDELDEKSIYKYINLVHNYSVLCSYVSKEEKKKIISLYAQVLHAATGGIMKDLLGMKHCKYLEENYDVCSYNKLLTSDFFNEEKFSYKVNVSCTNDDTITKKYNQFAEEMMFKKPNQNGNINNSFNDNYNMYSFINSFMSNINLEYVIGGIFSPCYPYNIYISYCLTGLHGLLSYVILLTGWLHSIFSSHPLTLIHIPRFFFYMCIIAYRTLILYYLGNLVEHTLVSKSLPWGDKGLHITSGIKIGDYSDHIVLLLSFLLISSIEFSAVGRTHKKGFILIYVVRAYYIFLTFTTCYVAYYTARFFHNPSETWGGFIVGFFGLFGVFWFITEICMSPSLLRIGVTREKRRQNAVNIKG